eukprot:superscaffoldBa00001021_g8554
MSYGTGGSFMCPRLGEGLSGRGAWSQGSHTAAHCPELRAASQHQGGLALLPLLWGSVSVPGVAAQSGRPERARSCAHYDGAATGRARVGGQCSPVGGKEPECLVQLAGPV